MPFDAPGPLNSISPRPFPGALAPMDLSSWEIPHTPSPPITSYSTLLLALPGPHRPWNDPVCFVLHIRLFLLHFKLHEDRACPFCPVFPRLGGIFPACSSWGWVGLERASQPAPEPPSALCSPPCSLLAVQRKGGGEFLHSRELLGKTQPSLPAAPAWP